MIARVLSATVVGLDALLVQVELDVAPGLPQWTIVGLPDTAIKESRDRVRAAIKNSGYEVPVKRITVNLAPGDLKKEGSGFDLPIALALLGTEGVVRPDRLAGHLVIGELSLDGRVTGVRGVLSMALMARASGLQGIFVPAENAPEAGVVAGLVGGLAVYPVETLSQLVECLNGRAAISPVSVDTARALRDEAAYDDDFADVSGQDHAKRALEIAAAGGHNALMIGPPGAGKTMLARRLPTILPNLTSEEAVEVTRVHSVAGLLPMGQPLLTTRPFRAPHHTISDAGLIGGGPMPRPGEISLAHHGVLFLDELPEFHRDALEALRQPLEDGRVTVSRAAATLTYPARVMLVAAMNPCPCGYFTDPTRDCRCTPHQVQRYRNKVSGPLLDRIDLHVEVPAVPARQVTTEPGQPREASAAIRARVMAARARQTARYTGLTGVFSNAQLTSRLLKKYCRLESDGQRLLELAGERLGFSTRAIHRVLKVARTIADLEGADSLKAPHVAEAIQYRSLDRRVVG